jgi:hypothetical protein
LQGLKSCQAYNVAELFEMGSSALVSIPPSHSLLSFFFLWYQSGITRKHKQNARSVSTLIKHRLGHYRNQAVLLCHLTGALIWVTPSPLWFTHCGTCLTHGLKIWYQSKLWKDVFRLEVPPTLKDEVECRDFTEEVENSPHQKKSVITRSCQQDF